MKKIVRAAQDAGQTASWDSLEQFALGMHINGPQPKKWFPFVDSVYAIGKPFGFGTEALTSVGHSEESVASSSGLDLFGIDEDA